MISRLEQSVLDRFVIEHRLPTRIGMHRRYAVRPKDQPSAKLLLLSCAHYPSSVTPEAVEQQQALARVMQDSPHPSICRIEESLVEPDMHWIISTLPEQATLHDSLRQQGRMDPMHVAWLALILAEALSAATAKSWPRIHLDAHNVAADLNDRCAFILPPDLPLFGAAPAMSADPLQTVAFNPAVFAAQAADPVPTTTKDYVAPVAMLCCELLGQAMDSGPGLNEKFRPIPGLSAQQNTVLRNALAGVGRQPFQTLGEFVTSFTGISKSYAVPPGPVTSSTRRSTSTTVAPEPATAAAPTSQPTAQPPPLPAQPAPPPLPVEAPPLSVIPQGYEMLRELRHTDSSVLRLLKHSAFGEVLVTSIDISLEVSEAVRRLNDLIGAIRKSEGHDILRPLEVTGDKRVLHIARSAPSGPTLLNALRERGAVEKKQAATILASIHACYEALWSITGRRIMATTLDQFWWFPPNQDGGPQGLLFDPIQALAESDLQRALPRPNVHLARIFIHLLGHDGGSLTSLSGDRFTPLPELDARTNEILRSLLSAEQGDVSIVRLFEELQVTPLVGLKTGQAFSIPAVSSQSRRVPAAYASQAGPPLDRLRLLPQNQQSPALALVDDERFLLGRVATFSDYVAQFRPRNPVNDSRTRAISRVQLSLTLRDSRVELQDMGSANPTFVGDHRLEGPELFALPVTPLLASEYRFEIRQAAQSLASDAPEIENWPAVEAKPRRTGALLVRPLEREVMPFEAAWLFTDVALARKEAGVFTFATAETDTVVVRFLRHARGFWMECLTSGVEVTCNGYIMQPGEVVPLRDGDKISLGGAAYMAQTYSLEVMTSNTNP